VGRRLENFFWRIWSNEGVLKRISGVQVASQFSAITEGGTIEDRLPTPTQSPQSSRSFGSYYNEARNDHRLISVQSAAEATTAKLDNGDGNKTPTPSSPLASNKMTPGRLTHTYAGFSQRKIDQATGFPNDKKDDEDDDEATPTPSNPFGDISKTRAKRQEDWRPLTQRPPPILKKASSSGSGKSSKGKAIIALTTDDIELPAATVNATAGTSAEDSMINSGNHALRKGQHPTGRYTATRFSEEVAVSIPKSSTSVVKAIEKVSRSQGESSQKPGKRNPLVLASTAASKRPVVIRQKSSQMTQNISKLKPSPSPPGPNVGHRAISTSTEAHSTQGLETPSSTRSSVASLHLSESHRRSSPEIVQSSEAAEEQKEYRTGDEVSQEELDTRAGNMEREMPKHRSFTNLPSFTRKSTAVTALATSYQVSGLLDLGQAPSLSAKDKGKEVFHNDIVPLKAPAPSGRVPSAEEALPRTKSQVTLLLERSTASSRESFRKGEE